MICWRCVLKAVGCVCWCNSSKPAHRCCTFCCAQSWNRAHIRRDQRHGTNICCLCANLACLHAALESGIHFASRCQIKFIIGDLRWRVGVSAVFVIAPTPCASFMPRSPTPVLACVAVRDIQLPCAPFGFPTSIQDFEPATSVTDIGQMIHLSKRRAPSVGGVFIPKQLPLPSAAAVHFGRTPPPPPLPPLPSFSLPPLSPCIS